MANIDRQDLRHIASRAGLSVPDLSLLIRAFGHDFAAVPDMMRSFGTDILRKPEDPLNYQALADWMIDGMGQAAWKIVNDHSRLARGTTVDAVAFALRWIAKTGFRPGHRTRYQATGAYPNGRAISDKHSWCWWHDHARLDARSVCPTEWPHCAALPALVFLSLSPAAQYKPWRLYPCWWDAVVELAVGLQTMQRLLEGVVK